MQPQLWSDPSSGWNRVPCSLAPAFGGVRSYGPLTPSADYFVKSNCPLSEDSTSAPADTVAVFSPLNKVVYTFSNAMVGHAARVHAMPGPTVRVCPDTVKAALHELQSALVDKRPVAKLRV